MTTEYGQKIAGALRAVAMLHSDTSKLLTDCDKQIGKGRKSIFGNYATRDLTYNVKADCWMAQGVYRYYEAGPLLVDSVTVTFFNAQVDTEPLLKVSRIQYADTKLGRESASKEGGPRTVCSEWDTWWLFFVGTENRELGKVLTFTEVDQGRIAWARLVAVPLFSIERIEDVAELMRKVVESAAEPTKAT
jgi:hypothetical protein